MRFDIGVMWYVALKMLLDTASVSNRRDGLATKQTKRQHRPFE